MNSEWDVVIGSDDLPARGPAPVAKELATDNEMWPLDEATGASDELCRQLEHDSKVAEIFGDLDGVVEQGGNFIAKRYTPNSAIRINAPLTKREDAISFLSECLGIAAERLSKSQMKPVATPPATETCPCDCEMCQGDNCKDCQAETKCKMCMANEKGLFADDEDWQFMKLTCNYSDSHLAFIRNRMTAEQWAQRVAVTRYWSQVW